MEMVGLERKKKAKIIIGGQGVLNVKGYIDYFDIAVFGRAEGQINEILAGKRPNNVLDLENDPLIEKKYVYRQPQYLTESESDVGCSRKCYFCNYSWTRKHLQKGSGYKSTVISTITTEDDFGSLEIDGSGRKITALDGFSEESRIRVNKGIKNEEIISKLIEAFKQKAEKGFFLKTYLIAGYPWEDPGDDYINELNGVIKEAEEKAPEKNMKLYLKFHVSPFRPMPLTPMEDYRAGYFFDWRKYFIERSSITRSSDLIAWYAGQDIISPITDFESTCLLRAGIEDQEFITSVLINPKFRKMKSYQKMLYLKNEGYLEKFEYSGNREWSYLSAGHELSGLKKKFL